MTRFDDRVPEPHRESFVAADTGALPPYLLDVGAPQGRSHREPRVDVRKVAKGVLEQYTGRQDRQSDTPQDDPTETKFAANPRGRSFLAMIEVPSRLLDDVVRTWWIEEHQGDVVTVARCLRLRRPEGSSSDIVSLDGRLRQLLPGVTIRMRLELWPHLDGWALFTMRPVGRAVAWWWYFRTGNRALEQMSRRLVLIAQDMEKTTRRLSRD